MNNKGNQPVRSGQDQPKVLGLQSLQPKFQKELHDTYLRELKTALSEAKSRNIALSGNYGVGKSSILQKLEDEDDFNVLSLSLSALTPAQKGDTSAESDTTNRIQREVVKQILYRAKPSETPDSRFGRIDESTPWGQIAAASTVGGFVAWLVFVLTGWAENLSSVVFNEEDPNGWFFLGLFVVLCLGLLSAIRFIWHPRHARLSEVNAGVATIKLDKGSTSYFDQYLDEIVYLFQRKKYDVVVFEDIDRFEDSEIFETLRALNTILNASPQIDYPVRFVYAIKDSIFDPKHLAEEAKRRQLSQDLEEEAEAARANRTKFFDRIIPVVPFVSQHNAHELMDKVLEGIEHDIKPELLRLAGRYMPDMRLLTNTANEFRVFHDRIFSGAGKQLDLDDTQLFAMMLYKNTNLREFEKIRLGESSLDRLFRDFEEQRSRNVTRLAKEAAELKRSLQALVHESEMAVKLGEDLLSHFELAKEYFADGWSTNSTVNFGSPYLEIDEETFDVETVKKPRFWNAVASKGQDVSLSIRTTYPGSRTLTLSKEDIRKQLRPDHDLSLWQEPEKKQLNEKLRRISASQRLIRGANLHTIWTQSSNFRFEQDDQKVSGESWLESFVGKELVFELVADGHIDENFTLYSSTFHGRAASAKAMNFILRHIQQGDPAHSFVLEPDDAAAVISEQGDSVLKDPAAYNVFLLDHALRQGGELARVSTSQLARLSHEERSFLDTYLVAGEEVHTLVQAIALGSEDALSWLISRGDRLDPARLDSLVNTALASLNPELDYTVDEDAADYFRKSWRRLPALLASAEEAPEAREVIGQVFETASVQIDELSEIHPALRSEIRDRGLFRISAENLTLLAQAVQSEDVTIALDDLRRALKPVYDYCLHNLDEYLDAVQEVEVPSVRDPRSFPEILREAAERDESDLPRLVSLSADDCRIEDLETTPVDAWQALAKFRRFPETLRNVHIYLAERGGVDEDLQFALRDVDGFLSVDEDLHEEKMAVAKALITQAKTLTPARRVRLIKSLQLDEPLDGSSLAAEESDLFPRLLREGLIEDNLPLYDHFTTLSWGTREKLITESESFTSYITAEGIHPPDLELVFNSPEIPEVQKRQLLERLADFVEVAPRAGLQAAAEQALELNEGLSLYEIQSMAEKGVKTEDIVATLRPHLDEIELVDLQNILTRLPEPHSKLAKPGKRPDLDVTPENQVLVDTLERLGAVASQRVKGDKIKVVMKQQ